MIWPRTNFKVVIGPVELSCAEVFGFGSQTAPGSEPAAAHTASAGPSAPTGSGTAWSNDVGPWISADANGHPPHASSQRLEWTLTPVTIRRALDTSQALFAWRAAVVAGQPDLRDVTIEVLDSPGGHPVLTWVLHDAWPLSWSGPVLDALAPGIALEQAELAYARLQWLNEPQTGAA